MNDTMNECVIEWIKGDKVAGVTMPKGTRLYNKILKMAQNSEDISIKISKDGSMYARIPTAWVKINQPRTLTEEKRKELSERMKNTRSGKMFATQ